MNERPPKSTIKRRIWEIVFEAETTAGRWFDITLLWLIIASVVVVMLETVDGVQEKYEGILFVAEWSFTILFTIEYVLRVWLSRRTWRYVFSFFGIVDLLSCIPTYLGLFPMFNSGHSLRVVRILRLLRMFRVLKMVHHIRGANVILRGLMASRAKITVFFVAVLILAIIAGTLMYIVESEVNDKFSSIPQGIYYAIVSISTVGYGDVTAVTPLGKFLTTILILAGYAIIAVPTGIVTSEFAKAEQKEDETTDACPGCGVHGHLLDAKYCRKCGEELD